MTEIIAIDGPASAGKSSIAKKISKKFNAPILFSGKLYRAVALELINRNLDYKKKSNILMCVKSINDSKLNSTNLYSSRVDKIASLISSKKYLRDSLKNYQRNFPRKYSRTTKYVIVEGRDIGTVIFPAAKYKIFMWADTKTRATRRLNQIRKSGRKTTFSKILKEIKQRDFNDLNRKIAPLKPSVNSVLLDTTYLDIEQVFNVIKNIIDK